MISNDKLIFLKNELETKYNIKKPHNMDEIIASIKKVDFSDKNKFWYITEETSNLMANSTNSSLKEWGNKCKDFYKEKNWVNPINGLAETGLVKQTRSVGFIHNMPVDYHLQYNPITNDWNVKYGYFGQYGVGRNAPDILNIMTQFELPIPVIPYKSYKLLSLHHIAAIVGDMDLLLNTPYIDNGWDTTPLELAVEFENFNIVEHLLTQQKIKNIDKALKMAVTNGSFLMIQLLVKNEIFTDEILQAAHDRDEFLFIYLDSLRKNNMLQKINEIGPIEALQYFLDYNYISIQTIIDIIIEYPEIIFIDEPILHSLIIQGKQKQVKALLEAIHEVKLTKKFVFDVERKSKDKTILDLALSQPNNEIVSMILLYCDPNTNDVQKLQIINRKIDLVAINQKRNSMTQNIICSLQQKSNSHNKILTDCLYTQLQLKQELEMLKNQNKYLMEQASIQNSLLIQVCKKINIIPELESSNKQYLLE